MSDHDGLTAHAPTAPPATILVVDDRSSNREFVRATLDEQGYRVRTASSGHEALALWEKEPADCVVLDVRMPDLDGFDVFHRLRGLPGGADTPVLFLTAQRDVDAFDRALGLGAADFLTKPIKPAELLLRVSTALQMRRLGAERDDLHEVLRRQRDDLLRVMLQKERLAAFLVHDLKNPVGGMKLAAHLLLADPEISPRTKDIAERIRQDATKLLRMIVDLLDISMADEGRLTLSHDGVEIEPLVDEVIAAMRLRADTRDVNLDGSIRCRPLTADRELLRRLLENLVENAIRHAPCGSQVSVRARDEGAGVELSVRDVGCGVPPTVRDVIFDRFLNGERVPHAGQGLGLPFCKLVAEAHGGRIWVEDGHPGSRFCVWLPHDGVASARDGSPSPGAFAGSGRG